MAAGSDAEFGSLAGGGSDIAATTTAERIMFAPGAAAMSDASLRIVLRHELFHFASRADTAADAPRWLTEGVADFVGRPPPAGRRHRGPAPQRWRTIPTDADLDAPQDQLGRWPTTARGGSAGSSPTRTAPPRCGRCTLRACGPGHPDAATAVRDTLGADLPTVLAGWRQLDVRLA